MSFAMDDVSQVSDVRKLQGILKTQNYSKTEDESVTSEYSNVQPLEKFALSENFDSKISNFNESLVQMQEQKNIIEQATKDLETIKKSFGDIEQQAQKVKENDLPKKVIAETNKNIKKSLDDIDQKAKDSKFNDQKLLDGSMSDKGIKEVSLKAFDFSKNESIATKDDAKKLQEKAQKTAEEIKNRQDMLAQDGKSIVEEVDSTIELETGIGKENAEVTEYEKVEAVKSDIQKEVFKSPAKSVKMQIKHLDKDIILAMLSLRQG
jgi:hypothetical protein